MLDGSFRSNSVVVGEGIVRSSPCVDGDGLCRTVLLCVNQTCQLLSYNSTGLWYKTKTKVRLTFAGGRIRFVRGGGQVIRKS